MKRLVVCCDGTWQRLESPFPTNVERIAQAVKSQASDGTAQVIYYHEGIGTWDEIDKLLGGAFGIGIDQHIQLAYLFLALNYDPGDEVYLFGFSRGAYTVRSLAGMLNRCGLVIEQNIRQIPTAYSLYRRPRDLTGQQQHELDKFRTDHCISCEIHLLGCFDTVGALGVPNQIPWLPIDKIFNDRLRFHDTTISGIVRNAVHACAIDECRKSFEVTPMMRNWSVSNQSVEQMWFVGDHGCIGGGDPEKVLLSNITLHWMMARIKELGLRLELDFSAQPDSKKTDYSKEFRPDIGFIFRLNGLINRMIDPHGDVINEEALKRFLQNARYQPVTLVKGLQDQADFRQLNPLKSGQSKSFVVDSAKLWNRSGIALERGRVYDVNVEADQTWKDSYISTDADGYTREALRPFEFLRRVPDQNWLKLIGAIGRDENSPIIIGSAMTNFSPSKSGELLCFANDVGWMYWNNRGSLRVTVTRTK
jgi:hypothetical protein